MVKTVITLDEYDSIINKSKDLVVVDFYADWCSSCGKFSKFFDETEEKHKKKKVTFLKCNYENMRLGKLVRRYKIRAMPTILFIKSGEVIEKVEGAEEEKVTNFLKKHNIK